MGFIKDIKELKEESKKNLQLTKDIFSKTESFTKENNYKIKKYEEISELLKNIKISVKDSKLFVNNDGLIGVEIEYDIPKIKLFLDEDGKMIKNNLFYSINMLNLISIEDMEQIQNKIEEAKKYNKR